MTALLIQPANSASLFTRGTRQMSDGITLSDDLIHDIYGVIHQHDQAVEQNMMLVLQYLAAASGVMLADYPGSDEDRDELVDQLAAFTKHVADDQRRQGQHPDQQPTQQQPAAGQSVPTDDPAVGIWKPE